MAGALGAIGTGSASVLTSCAGGAESAANKPLKEPGTYYIPELPDKANDGKELKATEAIKDYAEKKLTRIEKYFGDEAIDVTVTIKKENATSGTD